MYVVYLTFTGFIRMVNFLVISFTLISYMYKIKIFHKIVKNLKDVPFCY